MPSHEETEDIDMADDTPTQTESKNEPSTEALSSAPLIRKRPKLDLSSITDAAGSRKGANGERRKGKSIFGVVLGTLNKAKLEDKQRMASEAVRHIPILTASLLITNVSSFQAKKRQEIDARLQAKLAREQDIVRKQDESRKDQLAAKRKQEDLSIKDSIVRRVLCIYDFVRAVPNCSTF